MHRVKTRPPQGSREPPVMLTGEALLPYLEDAARTPGGHTPLLAEPASEAQVADLLLRAPSVLTIGAQSSLTGGATPFGEWLLATRRFQHLEVGTDSVRVGVGVALQTLEAALAAQGINYPPAPTFRGAFVGGTLATNAHGAATFKYGSTRDFVNALTVVLASGEVLDLERGACRADGPRGFEIETLDGTHFCVPAPDYPQPQVPKCSAGYHPGPDLDLIDLFVGSEGTLGVITEATLRTIPAPNRAWVWVTFEHERAALAFTDELRAAAQTTWARRDPNGIDVAAIESLDRRSLELLREDGHARLDLQLLPPDADTALLIELELPQDLHEARRFGPEAPEGPFESFTAFVCARGLEERLFLASPDQPQRAERFFALREAVPEGINRRIREWQRTLGLPLSKTAGDMIVPFGRLAEMVALYRMTFEQRELDYALFGHVSDGNLHANVLPRDLPEQRRGQEALLELGRAAIRLGGCPLAEHGVGRSPLKQRLLLELRGEGGLAQMRAVKAALDPQHKLAPGVLFGMRQVAHT